MTDEVKGREVEVEEADYSLVKSIGKMGVKTREELEEWVDNVLLLRIKNELVVQRGIEEGLDKEMITVEGGVRLLSKTVSLVEWVKIKRALDSGVREIYSSGKVESFDIEERVKLLVETSSGVKIGVMVEGVS